MPELPEVETTIRYLKSKVKGKKIISIKKSQKKLRKNLNFKDEVYIGIRPEDISIQSDRDIQLDVKVDLIENLGSEKIVYARLFEKQIIIKSSEDISNQQIFLTSFLNVYLIWNEGIAFGLLSFASEEVYNYLTFLSF